jgi:hypothetical protein
MSTKPQNDYGVRSVLKPTYRLDLCNRQGSAGNITMSVNGGEQIVFELVAQPTNLSKCYLKFNVAVAAQAADFVQMFLLNLPFFTRIEYFGRNNVNMVDITNAPVYTRIVTASDSKKIDLLTQSSSTPLVKCGTLPAFQTATGVDVRYAAGVAANDPYDEPAYFI